jgi:hypothetical protein
VCPSGYQGNPISNQCIDVNECATGNFCGESERCEVYYGNIGCRVSS